MQIMSRAIKRVCWCPNILCRESDSSKSHRYVKNSKTHLPRTTFLGPPVSNLTHLFSVSEISVPGASKIQLQYVFVLSESQNYVKFGLFQARAEAVRFEISDQISA